MTNLSFMIIKLDILSHLIKVNGDLLISPTIENPNFLYRFNALSLSLTTVNDNLLKPSFGLFLGKIK